MRHLIKRGIATKAAISAGKWADISGTLPDEIRNNKDGRGRIRIGDGIMSINTWMGTALIAAHKFSSKDSGALLLFDCEKFSKIPEGIIFNEDKYTIDWIHSNHCLVNEICERANLDQDINREAEKYMRNYIENNKTNLKNEWIKNTKETLYL